MDIDISLNLTHGYVVSYSWLFIMSHSVTN